MTRDEINRKISFLRNEWAGVEMSGGTNGAFEDITIPKDWHADVNWPTLFREMPLPSLWMKLNRTYACTYQRDTSALAKRNRGPDISDAVCRAWLKWKDS
jgi:hypothetical protein